MTALALENSNGSTEVKALRAAFLRKLPCRAGVDLVSDVQEDRAQAANITGKKNFNRIDSVLSAIVLFTLAVAECRSCRLPVHYRRYQSADRLFWCAI